MKSALSVMFGVAAVALVAAPLTSYAGGTITGKVTSGLFTGHIVTGQIKFAVKGTPNCTTKPVKSVTFHNTKAFKIH